VSANAAERLRAAVSSYYAEFGTEACEIIFNEVIKPGGMPRLLKLLGLQDPGYSDEQYATLLDYLRDNGLRPFYSILLNQGPPQPRESREGSSPAAPPQNLQRVRATLPADATGKSSGPSPVVEVRRREAPPPAAEPKGKDAPPPAEPKKAEAPPKWVDTPEYKGPERRSGKERRSGEDRRKSVETIFKNRRFGGERRSGKDRRKNWKPWSS